MNSFKKVQVLALPYDGKITDKPFSVKLIKSNQGEWQWGNPVGQSEQAYHLYLLSDDKIKVGDVYYSGDRTAKYGIHICDSDRLADICNQNNVKKVIASTDNINDNIFGISNRIVEAFILSKGNMKEIELEIEFYITIERQGSLIGWRCNCGKWHPVEENICDCDNWYYVNYQNISTNRRTVRANYLYKKQTYKRSEVIVLLGRMQAEGIITPKVEADEFDKWIENNI